MTKKLPSVFVVYFVSLLVVGVVVLLTFNKLPPQIPLLYSLSDPSDHVVDAIYLFVIPVLSLVCILLNNGLSQRLFPDDPFVARLIYLTNIIVIIFFTFIFVRIVFLVT